MLSLEPCNHICHKRILTTFWLSNTCVMGFIITVITNTKMSLYECLFYKIEFIGFHKNGHSHVFLWHLWICIIGMLCINEEMYRYVTSGSEGPASRAAVHYGRTQPRPGGCLSSEDALLLVPAVCPDPPNNTTAAAWASPAPTTSSVFSLCCVSEQWARPSVWHGEMWPLWSDYHCREMGWGGKTLILQVSYKYVKRQCVISKLYKIVQSSQSCKALIWSVFAKVAGLEGIEIGWICLLMLPPCV